MTHDADHSIPQHADRRRIIARPVAYPTLTEVELLQRAARHIRLRPDVLAGPVRSGGESSSSPTTPPARDAGA